MIFSSTFLIPILTATAYAANDWTKPCFQGECSYDLPQTSEGSATGTIRIWGAENAIADITTVGGWVIMGCDSGTTAQDIRLVCQSDDAESACSHLYENGGAVDKIVRLPENCGSNAFARISRSWVPEDQTVPADVVATLVRRDGVPPEVKALSLDTDFGAADTSKNGPIGIAIQGMNVPGYKNTLSTVPIARRRVRRRYSARTTPKRGLFDVFDDAVDFVGDALSSFTEFDIEKSTTLPPIDIDEPFNLVDETLDCGAVKATFKADVNAKAHAVVDIGVVATGTIIPPKLDNFNVFSGLTADLTGTLSLVADAIGTLETPEITIFEVGIPGLNFPGILQIGPSFKVNALAKATLDVKLDMEVGLNYQIKNARLVFPPNEKQQSAGEFNIADTPLKLSVSPSVQATGTLEAHLVPTLDFGIDAFSTIKATVFLNLDAAAILELTLKAGAKVDINVGNESSSAAIEPSTASASDSASTTAAMEETSHVTSVVQSAMQSEAVTSSMAPEPSHINSSDEAEPPMATPAPPMHEKPMKPKPMEEPPMPMKEEPAKEPMMHHRRLPRRHLATLAYQPKTKVAEKRQLAVSTETDTFFGGCVALKTGLTVNAGADADFLGLFNPSTEVELFSREFELFKKCFGDDVENTKRSLVPQPSRLSSRQLGGLVCAAAEIGTPASVTDGNVKAADIKAL